MKKLLFVLPVIFFLNGSAQQANSDFKNYLEKKKSLQKIKPPVIQKKNKGENEITNFQSLINNGSFPWRKERILFTLKNGTRVIELPKDRMICLVPDMSQFNMPVAGKDIKITGMPPGWIPFKKIIPGE